MDYIYDSKFRIIKYNDKTIKLTKTEDKLFKLFLRKEKRTYEEIYESIYDVSVDKITSQQRNTINVSIYRLKDKIYRIALIDTIRDIGYEYKERKDKR